MLTKKTTELVLLFHTNITKLVFLSKYRPKKLQSVNNKAFVKEKYLQALYSPAASIF